MREKKKVSRTALSKITRLSTYQVEGLEGKATQHLLSKIRLYMNGLGYGLAEALHLVNLYQDPNESILVRGDFAKTISETTYQEGVKLATYVEKPEYFFGQLHLAMEKSLNSSRIPFGDLVFGIVREGTLMLEILAHQTIHKKDQIFIMPGDTRAVFSNPDLYRPASVLLFSIKHPQ